MESEVSVDVDIGGEAAEGALVLGFGSGGAGLGSVTPLVRRSLVGRVADAGAEPADDEVLGRCLGRQKGAASRQSFFHALFGRFDDGRLRGGRARREGGGGEGGGDVMKNGTVVIGKSRLAADAANDADVFIVGVRSGENFPLNRRLIFVGSRRQR